MQLRLHPPPTSPIHLSILLLNQIFHIGHNVCEISTWRSASTIVQSVVLVVWISLTAPLFLSSSSFQRIECSLWAFSFKNSKALLPLLRVFLVLPTADSFDFCFGAKHSFKHSGPSWFLQLPLYHLTFSFLLWKTYLVFHIDFWAQSSSDNPQSMPIAPHSSHCMCLNLGWNRFHRSLMPLVSFITIIGLLRFTTVWTAFPKPV